MDKDDTPFLGVVPPRQLRGCDERQVALVVIAANKCFHCNEPQGGGRTGSVQQPNENSKRFAFFIFLFFEEHSLPAAR